MNTHEGSLALRRSAASTRETGAPPQLRRLLELLHDCGYRPAICATGEGWLIAVRGEEVIATSPWTDVPKLFGEVRAFVRREGLPIPADALQLVR